LGTALKAQRFHPATARLFMAPLVELPYRGNGGIPVTMRQLACRGMTASSVLDELKGKAKPLIDQTVAKASDDTIRLIPVRMSGGSPTS
jgi:hypothetical protein